MNAALRIAEAPRLWAPQLALRPSARRSAEMMDGHELPVDVVCEGPGASKTLPVIGPRNLDNVKSWRLNDITNDGCKQTTQLQL